MSQESVLNLLKKHPQKKFSSKEINEILKYNAAAANLRKLYAQGDIRRMEVKTHRGRGMKYVYYIK